ncbi:ImmA/IrrE family metallo-endopeptidase [Streptomyces hyderabadensis]|uniref:ImmA/IrrE family metallo-endopeptidase n=1 Tax=Streptomyces hyderabadensis TaxID=598549 RepID=A0ABP9I1I0_9ACTN|nr:XRE family transcriptional regulator [Streptomyces hyderabadensis]
MTINPRMLILAREAQGLTQQDLAKATGLAQSTLSKAENGLRPLPEADVPQVAKALRVTPELLTWQEEVYGFGSASFFHRKQQSLSQRTLRKIQARVNLLRMRLVRLSDGIAVDTSLTIPRIDIDDVETAAEAARRVRAAWRLPMGPVPNLVNIVEAAGGTVVLRDFETHRINAISVWHPGSGPLFVLNSELSPERQRFVLAHEIGHMVMHEGEPPRDTAEKEADAFAEELLMPAAEIAKDLGGIDVRRAAALKPYWRVPMQSLIIRAEHLGIISSPRSRSLHAYMNKAGYLVSEPAPLQREEPQVYREMLRIHVEEHDYSIRELSHVVGMTEEELADEITPPSRRGLRLVRG